MDTLGYDSKDALFKRCIHLISTHSGLAYCITYHDWINQCPSKCPFFRTGTPGDMEHVKKNKFNPECFYFVRSDINSSNYQCKLFKQENPFCESCQYLKTSDEETDVI